MNPYAYIRVSTEEQAEKGNSLHEQQERLTAYCRAMDWDEPIWYIDDGYSAKDTRRKDLTRMITDIRRNKSDEGIVLTTKLDRLSRNLFDILSLIKHFDKYNFKYISATESFDTSTAAGRLTLQLLGMVAEFERERNSERVQENMMSIARKIQINQTITRPCYGYDIVNGHYIINIEESANALNMAYMTLENGPRATVRWLNNEGITTKDGNQWHEKVLREYLQRETLIGYFVWNKTTKRGNKVIPRPQEEWVIIEDHHPAIFDMDLHQRLLSYFRSNKTIGRRTLEDRYLLSGLVICGHCGAKMNGKMDKNYSKSAGGINIHYNYVCDGYVKRANCFHHYVNRDNLETLIIKRIHEISQQSVGPIQLAISRPKTVTLERETIIAKLERLDRKLQKQIEAYEDDLISREDLKRARVRVDEERLKLQETLQSMDSGVDQFDQKRVRDSARKFVAQYPEMDRLKTKLAIREIIHTIELKNGEEINVTWRSNL